ncbi:hypothetical protein EVAR_101751_1 [Eumeta japonica]|uniref:Uncharacterized protein n=1 Tax=Eumeta variegata TaxID=151549 RepID=A0A4C1SPV4_EUMVA|nr:hypothetical protein EVAR_101751_1 [Eumeta japonica]
MVIEVPFDYRTSFAFFRRETAAITVRGLRWSDPRPVHPEGGPGPGVARGVPQVPGVPAVPRRVVHLLRQRRQDLLQERLHQHLPTASSELELGLLEELELNVKRERKWSKGLGSELKTGPEPKLRTGLGSKTSVETESKSKL